MSAVASTQHGSVREICKNVKDFDNYEELEVDSAATNVIVFQKNRAVLLYPLYERLVVNVKTRQVYHILARISRYEYGGGKLREEVSLEMNKVEFYAKSVANKAEGLTPSDFEKVDITTEVKEAFDVCCKLCGIESNDWTELAAKLDIDKEYADMFQYASVLSYKRAEDQKAEFQEKLLAKKAKEDAKKAAIKAKEDLIKAEQEKLANCLHNTTECPHVLKRRCYTCRKKIGMNAFSCGCEKLFCAVHQTPLKAGDDLEKGHVCDFNHSAKAQDKLLEKYSHVLE